MELKKYMAEKRVEIDNHITGFIIKNTPRDKDLDASYGVIKEYILNGGKRIRPIACLMAFNALNSNAEARGDAKTASISIEFMHNSTLCHDDIMDEDDARRGKPSCHKTYENNFIKKYGDSKSGGPIFSKNSIRYGTSIAIIAGNIFTFLGYKAIDDSSFPEKIKNRAVRCLSDAIMVVNHGQILDIEFENRKEITEKEYFSVVEKKTAALLAASFELGATLADSDEQTIKRFHEYGFELGVAFQIVDDLMDIDPTMKKGHALGSDITKGKKTIMLIKALELTDNKEELRGFIAKNDIGRVIEVFSQSGAIDYAKNLAKEKVESAKKIVKSLKIREEDKRLLLEFADLMTERRI